MYKHAYGRDVAMRVLSLYKVPEKCVVKLKIAWYNVSNPDNVFSMGLTDRITIPYDKLQDWKLYDENRY